MREGVQIPNVVFKTRVRDESIEGPNPYRWQDVDGSEYFAGKRVVLFSSCQFCCLLQLCSLALDFSNVGKNKNRVIIQ